MAPVPLVIIASIVIFAPVHPMHGDPAQDVLAVLYSGKVPCKTFIRSTPPGSRSLMRVQGRSTAAHITPSSD